ncbi:MAG TPA: thiol-disulfide oxidoreductase [Bacteroidales bacterium]|jgi:predicted DCC family thiol-disulfide oxidoreductase YuxK|nr:thiol-disulfide oxidoreductase [Bacteroidales bacterium]
MEKKPENKNIVLFDGLCNLCSWSVNFIIKRDYKDIFRFASLQSETGKHILIKFKLHEDFDKSIVLVENNSVYFKSDAALRIAKELRRAWPLFYSFIIFPKVIRDYMYTFIASKRFKWFGKRDTCHIPTTDYRYKFL